MSNDKIMAEFLTGIANELRPKMEAKLDDMINQIVESDLEGFDLYVSVFGANQQHMVRLEFANLVLSHALIRLAGKNDG